MQHLTAKQHWERTEACVARQPGRKAVGPGNSLYQGSQGQAGGAARVRNTARQWLHATTERRGLPF